MTKEVKIMQEKYEETPSRLKELVARKEEIFAAVADVKLAESTRIFLVANGSSGEGLQVASFLWEHLLDIKPFVCNPYQFTHYETKLRPTDIVLALSQTGTSHEVVESLRIANRYGATSIGITCIADTPIVKVAKYPIALKEVDEDNHYKIVGVVVNMLAAFLVGYGLAIANGLPTNLEADMAEMAQIIERYPEAEATVKAWVNDNFAFLDNASGFTVVGSGPNLEAAEELNIKMIETINKQGAFFDLEEYMHGGCAVMDPDHILIMIVDHDNKDYAGPIYHACQEFGKKIVWLGVNAPPEQINLTFSENSIYATFDAIAAGHAFTIAFAGLGGYGAKGAEAFEFYQQALKIRED